jgi:hypothetical protein
VSGVPRRHPDKGPINVALLIRSDNHPVTLRHPDKCPINEALLMRSANLPVTLRHPGQRAINEALRSDDRIKSDPFIGRSAGCLF